MHSRSFKKSRYIQNNIFFFISNDNYPFKSSLSFFLVPIFSHLQEPGIYIQNFKIIFSVSLV